MGVEQPLLVGVEDTRGGTIPAGDAGEAGGKTARWKLCTYDRGKSETIEQEE